MRIAAAGAYWFFPLLAVAFWPLWPDFERARRFELLALAGALGLLVFARARELRWRNELGPFLLLAALFLVSSAWPLLQGEGHPVAGVLRALYLLALVLTALVFVHVSQVRSREDLMMGIALATLLTSAFGIAQALGLAWPPGYTVPHEIVSSLGNRNVAAEWTLVGSILALALALGATGPARAVGRVAFLASVAYLWANGGRGALLCHSAATAFVLQKHVRSLSLMAGPSLSAAWVGPVFFVLASAGAGSAFGILERPSPPAAAPASQPAAGAASRPAPAPASQPAPVARTPVLPESGAVRLHVWRSTLDLIAEQPLRPLLGIGSGQWEVHYPRFRDQREIELSSGGRQFPTRVDTAHNDHLEILAETGALGLALWLWFLWSAARRLRKTSDAIDTSLAVALLALAASALFRSPLFNAPAAAAAFAALALAPVVDGASVRVLPRSAARAAAALAAILLVTGALGLASEFAASGYLDRARKAPPGGIAPDAAGALAALDNAILLNPFEDSLHLLRAEHVLRNLPDGAPPDPLLLRRAADDISVVLAREPYSVHGLELAVVFAMRAGDAQGAERAIANLLRLDPLDRIGLRAGSKLALAHKDLAAAVPHLRTLARRYGDRDVFAEAATMLLEGNDVEGARRMLAEHTEVFPDDPLGWETLSRTFGTADPLEADLRRRYHAESLFAWAKLRVVAGDLDGADAKLAELRQTGPLDTPAALLDALVAHLRKDETRLAKALLRLTRQPPTTKDLDRLRPLGPALRDVPLLGARLRDLPREAPR